MSTGKNNAMAFKTALRGYSKESVNEYIAAVSEQRAQEAAELKAQIDQMRETADAEKAKAEAAAARASSAEAERDVAVFHRAALEKKLEEMSTRASKADTEICDLKARLEEMTARANEAETEIDNLKARLDESRNAAKVDTERASAAFRDAMAVSENLISSAQREATEIKRQAEVELELARDAVRKSATAAMRDINKMIDNAAELVAAELGATADDMGNASAKMNGKLAQKNNRIARNVSHIRSALDDGVESRIAHISIDEAGDASPTDSHKFEAEARPTLAAKARSPRAEHKAKASKGFNLSSVFGFKK